MKKQELINTLEHYCFAHMKHQEDLDIYESIYSDGNVLIRIFVYKDCYSLYYIHYDAKDVSTVALLVDKHMFEKEIDYLVY